MPRMNLADHSKYYYTHSCAKTAVQAFMMQHQISVAYLRCHWGVQLGHLIEFFQRDQKRWYEAKKCIKWLEAQEIPLRTYEKPSILMLGLMKKYKSEGYPYKPRKEI